MSGKHKDEKGRDTPAKSKIAKEMRGLASVKIKAKGPPGMIEKIAKKAVKAAKKGKK